MGEYSSVVWCNTKAAETIVPHIRDTRVDMPRGFIVALLGRQLPAVALYPRVAAPGTASPREDLYSIWMVAVEPRYPWKRLSGPELGAMRTEKVAHSSRR